VVFPTPVGPARRVRRARECPVRCAGREPPRVANRKEDTVNRWTHLTSRAALGAQTVTRHWRLLWIIASLGLIALGAGAPDEYDIP
jgi:hypothetical protein